MSYADLDKMTLVDLDKTINLLLETKSIKQTTADTYREATRALKIPGFFLERQDPVYKRLLEILATGKQAGYVEQVVSLIKTSLRVRGQKPYGELFFKLEKSIEARPRATVNSYSLIELQTLLRACLYNELSGFFAYKTVMTLVFTGSRVSGLAPIDLTSFKEVPSVPGLCYTNVIGKSKLAKFEYPVFMPKRVLEHLELFSNVDDQRIHNWNPEVHKSDFKDFMRAKLTYKVVQYRKHTTDEEERNRLKTMFADKSLIHSLRHTFEAWIVNDPSVEIRNDLTLHSFLLGQAPPTLAIKTYALGNNQNWDKSLDRLAKSYAASQMMTLDFYKELKPRW